MASYPPPPPTGAPFGYPPGGGDRRQQRDAMREQMRAQKAAWQAQKRAFVMQAHMAREQARAQMRGQRRSSILGPVLILAVGIVLLLVKLGRLPYSVFASWYGHWWPALLVLAGLVLVAEWALDQALARDNAVPVRRGIGGGAVVLLVFLGIAGAVMNGVQNHQPLHGFSINPDNLDTFFGEKHELPPQMLEQRIEAGSNVSIDNPHGDVSVVGKSDDNKVHITVTKQVYANSDADVESRGAELNPKITQTGNLLSIMVPSVNGSTADLSVVVPEGAEVTINANHGDVSVIGMKAMLNVTANRGDVDLRSIAGNVSARMNHNDSSFAAHDVTGDVLLRGHAQDVTVGDIGGATTLEGDFYGDTHMERLRGPMRFQTSRTNFTLARLDGEINIDSSDISGSQIVGPTALRVRSRNVSFERVVGDVDVTNSNGPVTVTSAMPLGNVSISTSKGEVNLTVPEHAGMTVDAETAGGDAENDLGLSTSKVRDDSTFQGTVGDGAAKVHLSTMHADINVRKGLVLAPVGPAVPAAPAAPAKPAVPSRPAKTGKVAVPAAP